ncbi:pimeloyl-ACP methyl ester esterase BioH [Shewanella dokdonensis]|uniref:pimeloyl-ACP methyl ester esterase BioH n=1 Tax=Shewanella dokdonensis TaxID=712036 RepID=UPI00200F4AE4|nr:pimeloyl-ACP methyl ester esterase BioH [Shewanella dokdonensis]MCL1075520.1 pimeloyl-ACP methyl ester esterase BioH [Shewanella dokdonensis]
MTSSLFYHVSGDGQPLVWLHGWGVNGSIFLPTVTQLSQYRSYCVDLPGFGDSQPQPGTIDDWAELLIAQLPANAIWLGWSLGGLVATRIAQRWPQKIRGLITIASSPCFMAQTTPPWPGIAATVLQQFTQQLEQDLQRTVERFMALQAMGSNSARDDIRHIKELVLSKPLPNATALAQGLEMLQQTDLRQELPHIALPWLRFWGKLDGLVPRRVSTLLPQTPQSQDIILPGASHAPFISHPEDFLHHLRDWLQTTNKGV